MPEAMNALERAIVSQDFSAIPPETLEQVNLAAYAYSKDKASRNAITKRAFLQYTMRHQVIKQAILPLLKAWSDAGIKVMLYKGFYLAEFVYDHPAERYYGDVDVIIPPEQIGQAMEVAQQAGFLCSEQRVRSRHHEAFTVRNLEGSVYVEVHHTSYPLLYAFEQRRRSQIDSTLWSAPRPERLKGACIYLPNAIDSMLLSILDRYMNAAEFMRHKVSDYNDMRALQAKYDVTEQDLLTRAGQLGMGEVVKLYLQRCNPWKQCFTQVAPRRTRNYQALRLLRYGRTAELERLLADGPRTLLHTAREGLSILRSLSQLQRIKQLSQLFAVSTPQTQPPPPADDNALKVVSRGVKWASLLLRPLIRLQGSGMCLVRSLTLYRRLLQEGYRDIRFVSGVRRDAGGNLQGHAWVEHEGKPLAIFGDMRSPQLYKETWCYPPRDPEAQEAA